MAASSLTFPSRRPIGLVIASAALILSILFVCNGLYAATIRFPQLTGRVVDEAGILATDTAARLDRLLAGHEQRTTNQIAVVTLNSLQGRTIEEFGRRLGRHWGIGQAEKNNGVLLIIAPNERKVRIEVGYGLENLLTDGQAKMIIEREILPHFRQGAMDTGIVAGVVAVLQTLGDTSLRSGGAVDDWPELRSRGDGVSPVVGALLFLAAAGALFFLWRYRRKRRAARRVTTGRTAATAAAATAANRRDDRDQDNDGHRGGGGDFGGGGASGQW